MTTLLRFEVTKTLKIEESILQNWLTLIEANYHTANSYHNSSHAADVLQVSDKDSFFISTGCPEKGNNINTRRNVNTVKL